LDDELDEKDQPANQQFTKTYVWDVTSIDTPVLRSIFESSERSIDHNQYIIGNFSFQGNYESGVRILHINPQTFQLSLAAYIDVFPTRTTTEFNGVWSVYPYFPSGNILAQSINHGLFVVKPDWDGIHARLAKEETYAEQTRTRPILSNGVGATCPALVETKTCSAPALC